MASTPICFSLRYLMWAQRAAWGYERFIVLGFTGFVRDWNGLNAVLEWRDPRVGVLSVGGRRRSRASAT